MLQTPERNHLIILDDNLASLEMRQGVTRNGILAQEVTRKKTEMIKCHNGTLTDNL